MEQNQMECVTFKYKSFFQEMRRALEKKTKSKTIDYGCIDVSHIVSLWF